MSCKLLQSLIREINSKSFVKLDCSEPVEIDESVAYSKKQAETTGAKQASRNVNDDNRQGIIHAQMTKDGSVILKLSLLAAGFVIGPGGKSINDVSMKTASQTTSWTFTQKLRDGEKKSMDLRVIVISGPVQSIIQSIKIIQNAVAKYKELVEESSPDTRVSQQQIVDGIEFLYKPPPLRAMPWAARTLPDITNVAHISRTKSATSFDSFTPRKLTPGRRVQSEPCQTISEFNRYLGGQPSPPASPPACSYSYGLVASSPAPPVYLASAPNYSTPITTPRYFSPTLTTPGDLTPPSLNIPPASVAQYPSTSVTMVPMLYQQGSMMYGNCAPQTFFNNTVQPQYYVYPSFS